MGRVMTARASMALDILGLVLFVAGIGVGLWIVAPLLGIAAALGTAGASSLLLAWRYGS